MRIEFVDGTSVVYEIGEDRIESFELSGVKLISDDYFMNEPGSIHLTILTDSWLLERWEDEVVKINNALWFNKPVRVYDRSMISGAEELIMTGLLQATESSYRPVERRMEVVIYDYSALLSELGVKIRFYYPYVVGEGTSWDRFIINYQLPGEGENEASEDEYDGTPEDNPIWFPYLHTIETADRQVSSVLEALTTIWGECFEADWELQFNHAYEAEGSSGTVVNNYIVSLGTGDSFHEQFVQGLVNTAYNALSNAIGLENWQFYANHGFISAAHRMHIYLEFGMLPAGDCDGYFVMRSGYCGSGITGSESPHGWQGGNMSGGNGPFQYREWYRIFKLQGGECTYDSGQRSRMGNGLRQDTGLWLGSHVGGVALDSSLPLRIDVNSFYRCSANEYYEIPPAYAQNVMGYFYNLTYYVYFTGLMQGPGGYIGNRIFRMASKPNAPGQEQWIEQSLRDWFKTMLFIGDLSFFADETGILQIVPRSPLGDIELPMSNLTDIRQKQLVYQPWEKEKLREFINDSAEIDYLVAYYGGARVLTHDLELEFAERGWTEMPRLRQRFVLEGQIGGFYVSSGPKQYMIVGVHRKGGRKLYIRAVRV